MELKELEKLQKLVIERIEKAKTPSETRVLLSHIDFINSLKREYGSQRK